MNIGKRWNEGFLRCIVCFLCGYYAVLFSFCFHIVISFSVILFSWCSFNLSRQQFHSNRLVKFSCSPFCFLCTVGSKDLLNWLHWFFPQELVSTESSFQLHRGARPSCYCIKRIVFATFVIIWSHSDRDCPLNFSQLEEYLQAKWNTLKGQRQDYFWIWFSFKWKVELLVYFIINLRT